MQADDSILNRHSPYEFLDKPLSDEVVQRLFDAARHAASSYNEQPWRFIYATQRQPQAYDRILACLIEANQQWAKQAPLLILTFARNVYTQNGKANYHAQHDLGLAVGNLTVQASLLGLKLHSMGGIDSDAIRKSFGVPDTYDIMTAIALGYSDEQHNRKPRKEISEIAALGGWDFA